MLSSPAPSKITPKQRCRLLPGLAGTLVVPSRFVLWENKSYLVYAGSIPSAKQIGRAMLRFWLQVHRTSLRCRSVLAAGSYLENFDES
jgi:hypothetical protein